MCSLRDFGSSESVEMYLSRLPAGWTVGRVIGVYRHRYEIAHSDAIEHEVSITMAQVSGSFEYMATDSSCYPVIGDWVAVSDDGCCIQKVVPRETCLSRRRSGDRGDEQVLAAQVDTILFTFGLDGYRNFSQGLLERMQTICAASGADAAIVLNKIDIADPVHVEKTLSKCRVAAADIAMFILSASQGTGMEELKAALQPGKTYCCIGRSGVGKSSLINSLLGEKIQGISEVSNSENKGRHTTSNSRLFQLPGGALMIDTPGLRELQLWAEEDDLDVSFPEIQELAATCRFRDCKHTGEPGCSIQAALSIGELPFDRYEKYLEQRDELIELQERQSISAARYERQKWKPIAISQRKNT